MKHRLTAVLVGTGEDIDVPATLEYLTEDPFAVHLEFKTGQPVAVVWEFSREILIAGLVMTEWFGDGDVQVCRLDGDENGDRMAFRVESPNGAATLLLPLAAISSFVADVMREVPIGAEPVDENDLLNALANGGNSGHGRVDLPDSW